MPSNTTDALKFESYTTTPCSVALESSSGQPVNHENESESVDTGRSMPELLSRDVSKRAGVRSAPSHFSAQVSQSLTEKLLHNSEQCSLDDTLVFECSVVDDWKEAASGWNVVVPYPKYVAHPPPATHKTQSPFKKTGVNSRTAVRCVDEMFEEQQCPSWKGNVEPVTYRYVPNNGYYRNHKPMRDMKEWPVIKKPKSDRSHITAEMRQAQKTLKRDLENQFRNNSEESASTENSFGVSRTVTAQCRESSFRPGLTDFLPDAVPITKRLPAREQQLMKSARDLFMEKFNTRLSVLEKELQTPYAAGASKKPGTESSSAPNHSSTQLSKKLKEGRTASGSSKPTIQSTKQHGSDFGEDLFTVVPICKREVPLRPLEKLTPKQKQMEKNTSSHDRSPSPESVEEEEEEDLMIVLACATSHPPPLTKGPDSNGISTARSAIAMTNFDIEKMRNVPLHSEVGGSSRPKTFAVHKEGGGSVSRGMMRYAVEGAGGVAHPSEHSAPPREGGDRKDLLPHVDRSLETRLTSMSNALPEIMGKRLSVVTATHRLL
ncbi:hypothetical protein ACOMHN_039010 [Nucella lapillus]